MKQEQPHSDQLDLLGGPPSRHVKNPVHGYAARPGTGPAGEKCKTCACCYASGYNFKTYYKCSLVRSSGGPGTDIRLKSPACSQWRAKKEGEA